MFIHESKIQQAINSVTNLKKELFHSNLGNSVEFHTPYIYFRKKEYSRFTIYERNDLMERIAKIIRQNQAFNIVIHVKASAKKEDNPAQILAWHHLIKELKIRLKSDLYQRYTFIVDRITKNTDFKLKEKVNEFVANLPKIQSGTVISEPLFCDSELTTLIQLADFCAWISRRLNYYSEEPEDLQRLNAIIDLNIKIIGQTLIL